PVTACAPHEVQVHTVVPPSGAPVEGVTVTGSGKASQAPNIARATVGVETRSPTADQAMREASSRAAAIIAAVKAVGVAEKDIRTQNISLNFEREEPPRPLPVEPTVAPMQRAGKAAPQAPMSPAAPPAPVAPAGPLGFYR